MIEAPELAYTVHFGPEPDDAGQSEWPSYDLALAESTRAMDAGEATRAIIRGGDGVLMYDTDGKLDAGLFMQPDLG